MGYIALVRCVLVFRCGLAVVVWYPYAGWGTSAFISLFNAQHVSDVNTSILRSLRLILLSYFMGYIVLVRCVLVFRCGLAVVVWYPSVGWGTSASPCIRIPQHHSQTTTKHQHTSNQNNITHEITQQISRKLLRMDVLTSETCWALNNEIIKQVTPSWSLFIQLSRWCTVQ